MKKRNIVDVGQTCYEQFNLSTYIQRFINLFATSIDYIYIYQLKLLLNIHKDNNTIFMKQILHQSHQDRVSFHFHQSKSLLRSTSLPATLSMLGTTSTFLCKGMIIMTDQCRSLIRKKLISIKDVILKIKEYMNVLFKKVHQRRKKGIQCDMFHSY